MDLNIINDQFKKLIEKRGIYKSLGQTEVSIRQLRHRLRQGKTISLDLKLALLHKSGWRPENKPYSRKDLVKLLTFYKRTSQAARDEGPEYIIEKWERSRV